MPKIELPYMISSKLRVEPQAEEDIEEKCPVIKVKKQKEAMDLLKESRWKAAGFCTQALHLAREMISPEVLRCGAEQALNHPWLTLG